MARVLVGAICALAASQAHGDTRPRTDSVEAIAVAFEQGDYQRVAAQAEAILRQSRQTRDEAVLEFADLFGELASRHVDSGRTLEAGFLFEREYLVREAVLGFASQEVRNDLFRVWFFYLNRGHYDNAVEYLERSLALHEQELGTNDIAIPMLLYHLGFAHLRLGSFEQAERVLRRGVGMDTDFYTCLKLHYTLEALYEASGRRDVREEVVRRIQAFESGLLDELCTDDLTP